MYCNQQLCIFFLSSIAIATAAPASTPPPKSSSNGTTIATDKDKRSQEEIMFGNQQNRPAGMVDDVLALRDDTNHVLTNATVPEGHEKGKQAGRGPAEGTTHRGKEGTSGRFDYYDYIDDASGLNADLHPDRPQEQTDYSAYDYSDTPYRRKRTLSVRSSLEDLLTGGRRLPRRALRLKRSPEVKELLAWLSALENHDRPSLEKLVSSGSLSTIGNPDEMERQKDLGLLDEEYAPSYETSEMPLTTSDMKWEGIARKPSMQRRSSTYFYPLDYRYIPLPGQKRSVPEQPQGIWGPFATRRHQDDSAYLSRLYDLAVLLADESEPEPWYTV